MSKKKKHTSKSKRDKESNRRNSDLESELEEDIFDEESDEGDGDFDGLEESQEEDGEEEPKGPEDTNEEVDSNKKKGFKEQKAKNDDKAKPKGNDKVDPKDLKKMKELLESKLGEDYKKLYNLIGNEEQGTDGSLINLPILSELRIFLQELNEIRVQLARLDTNLAGLVYYENEVFPLLNSLFFLAGIGGDLSLIARNLQQINFAKTSKIKDAIDLTYDVDSLSEKVFDLVEIKIYKLLRILSNP